MVDSKVTVSELVPLMSKIIKHKLKVSNYLNWSKTIRIYLSIDKDDHLVKDQEWMILDKSGYEKMHDYTYKSAILSILRWSLWSNTKNLLKN